MNVVATLAPEKLDFCSLSKALNGRFPFQFFAAQWAKSGIEDGILHRVFHFSNTQTTTA
jgi:hypothetical protein